MKTVRELTRDEINELKGTMFFEDIDCNIEEPSDYTDEEVFNKFEGVNFTEDDFFCNQGKENNMKIYNYMCPYSGKQRVYLKLSRYCFGNTRLIKMICEDGEPWGSATVNIQGHYFEDDEVVLDTNNMPNIEPFILSTGVGMDTGKKVQSGFCTYPVYKLNLSWIKEMEEK